MCQLISMLRLLLCRSNARVLSVVALVAGLAAFNCLYMPLALEGTILGHPRTPVQLSRLPPGKQSVLSHFSLSLPHTGTSPELAQGCMSSAACELAGRQ